MELLTNYLNPLSPDFIFTKLFKNIGDLFNLLDPTGEKFIFTNFFKDIGNMVDWLNPFSDNFFLKKLFNWINPLSDDFFLKKLFNWINPLSDDFIGKKIVELFGDLLKALFVPSEDSINSLVNSVKSHFGFVDTIKDTAKTIEDMFSNTENLPKIALTLPENNWYNGQITVMDLSWYAPYKQYGDVVISAFIYVLFLWRMFINLPSIISGTGGGINDVSIASSDIEGYAKFGFGRRSSLNRRQR